MIKMGERFWSNQLEEHVKLIERYKELVKRQQGLIDRNTALIDVLIDSRKQAANGGKEQDNERSSNKRS